MTSTRCFDEVRVYAGVAERTGVQFHYSIVRRSAAYCRSLTELIRKVRGHGDGVFYLPVESWPGDAQTVDLQRQWAVLSSVAAA